MKQGMEHWAGQGTEQGRAQGKAWGRAGAGQGTRQGRARHEAGQGQGTGWAQGRAGDGLTLISDKCAAVMWRTLLVRLQGCQTRGMNGCGRFTLAGIEGVTDVVHPYRI
eukprot:scaffold111430_cov21-Tisochrysis_lutea.AAC.1